MLYDRLENIEQYTGLFENLDTAIAYIAEHDLGELPLGRTDIDGDKVFVKVTEADTCASEEREFEMHDKYMDVQLDLSGVELFEVALGELEETAPYDETTDTGLYKAPLSCAGVLGEDRFAVFMTGEAHKAQVRAAGCDKVRKAIFKVARD